MTEEPNFCDVSESGLTAEELRKLIAGNALFEKMTSGQMDELMDLVSGVRQLAPGQFLMHEGDPPDNLYLIRSGIFEVLKQAENSDDLHSLAELGAGMSIGEVSLLDAGPRSASVQNKEAGEVIVIPFSNIEAFSKGDEGVDALMKINLAYEMGRRLRTTNETTVRNLRSRLDEAEKRVEMGKFLSRVLVGLAFYMFAMGLTGALAQVVPDTSLVNIPILVAFAFGVYRTVRTSPYPLAKYGFTLANWRHNVMDSIVWSIAFCGVVVLLKFGLVSFVPSMAGTPVFELSASSGLPVHLLVLFALAYALFAPVQESIARSGIQCSLQMFLTGRYSVLQAIILSNLLFSATHLHVSLAIALMVMPAGLFWGWLFYRQGSIVGTSISHAMIGIFTFFIVGFPVF